MIGPNVGSQDLVPRLGNNVGRPNFVLKVGSQFWSQGWVPRLGSNHGGHGSLHVVTPNVCMVELDRNNDKKYMSKVTK